MKRILPAYPLFVKDPNFSLWITAEELNARNAETWFGEEKKLFGFLKTQGETYCFMGDSGYFTAFNVKKAVQTKLDVTAFSTDYEFECGKCLLKVRFVSPLPLTDRELLSMPCCYADYEIVGDPDAEIALFVNRDIAYNDRAKTSDKRVRGGVVSSDGFESAFIGLVRQLPLSVAGDQIGADWGYFYLSGEQAWLLDERELFAYLTGGYLNFSAEGEERYICAVNRSAKGVFLLGYDDRISVDYFGNYRKGYYLEKHSIFDALTELWHNRKRCEKILRDFEDDLLRRAAPYGQAYRNVLFASLRQSIAAHKLVRDQNGDLLFLSKECASNGCIATVDISYPSMPLYLLYDPELVKGMMRPILHFARTPVWRYDFAPHDAGTYPICSGQVYATLQRENKYCARIGEGGFWGTVKTHFPLYVMPENYEIYEFKMQMPVEECANMIIMFLAVYRKDGDISFFEANKDLCGKWVGYLVEYGLKPGNQLCTDDFAGALENNLNLAIKATVGIAAYAQLLFALGDTDGGNEYDAVARRFAREIVRFSEGKTHLPLTWDSGEETFSLKYNLAFDKILGLNLFPEELSERETDYYLTKAERYGTPLDSRKMYTKSDWLMWTAYLTDDTEKRQKTIDALNDYLQTSPDRVPFGDWYETQSGQHHEFKARSVQGGCFILLM